jgi:uncharacterized protein YgiB involved in biofilm formation
MKRSSKVTLTVVAVMGLAGCGRHYDPCDAQYFNAAACTDAIAGGGYFWHGTWYPMRYRYAYPFYFDAYQHHVSNGGKVFGTAAGTYSRPAASSTVTRGGFGAIGSGHSSGASS